MLCHFSYAFNIILSNKHYQQHLGLLKLTFLRAFTTGHLLKLKKYSNIFSGIIVYILLGFLFLHILGNEELPLRTLFAFRINPSLKSLPMPQWDNSPVLLKKCVPPWQYCHLRQEICSRRFASNMQHPLLGAHFSYGFPRNPSFPFYHPDWAAWSFPPFFICTY